MRRGGGAREGGKEGERKEREGGRKGRRDFVLMLSGYPPLSLPCVRNLA